jgi:hypothetical protein
MICTNFCKRLLIGIAFLYISTHAVAQETDNSTAAPAVKTFALDGDLMGAASNSVNLYTGSVTFPMNLIALPGHNNLSVSVSMSYNSNGVRQQAGIWNRESPTGITGLGWSLDMPKIVADYKQTGAKEDDEYYLIQNGSSNKLIRMNAAYDAVRGGYYYMYATKNYQFWKIRYYYDTYEAKGEGPGGANKWVITTEDGTEYTYGDQYSGRNTVQWMVRWSNWMGNSAQINGQGRLAIVWNLSQIVNVWNEKVTYEYEQVEQYVGSTAGQKHTEASYVKQITDVYGRKVQFLYKEKDPKFYVEPHTERAEPDAYQEQYERKYLDHLDVIQEDGSKLLSVHLTYSTLDGTNGTDKMLLTGITQRSGSGKAQPGMTFTYHTDSDSPDRGCLQMVGYPASGTVTYTYTAKTIPRSERELTINAPNGYAEPKIFQGEDYVAVVWRQLGSDGSHQNSSQDLVLYVYTWEGQWKEQFIGHIGGAELNGSTDPHYEDYKDFQATMQKDFFAFNTRTSSNTNNCYIVYRSQWTRGQWTANPVWSTQVGAGEKGTLLSGTNYIALAPEVADDVHPGILFTYTGDGFTQTPLNLPKGAWDYCGTNNYFIGQARGFNGLQPISKLYFYYLTEDRKWVMKDLEDVNLHSLNKGRWYAANSMAVEMAPDGPEYPYLWNYKYDMFFRDETNVDEGPIFGEVRDEAMVFIQNNSLVGMAGHMARFDGWYWHSMYAQNPANFAEENYSYGDDFVIRPRYYGEEPNKYKLIGGFMTFDPNQLAWQPDVLLDGPNAGDNIVSAGNDYYYYATGYWYRKPDGTWVKKNTDPTGEVNPAKPISGAPRFDVWAYNGGQINRVVVFKNGELYGNSRLNWWHVFDRSRSMVSHSVGSETIVTYQVPNYTYPKDAKTLRLNRLVDVDISGLQTDHPVAMVKVDDGFTPRYVSYKYEMSTAYFDPAGNSAQYNEVSVVPGSQDPDSHPYGYTKHFFNNGYSGPENGNPLLSYYWQGMLYETRVYDNNDQLVSSEKTDYSIYTKDILNVNGNLVYTSHYVRPTAKIITKDGVTTSAINLYDDRTGLIRESTMNDYNSKQNQFKTTYKYFWEQYDPNRIMNILSPVIQTKKSVSTASGQVVTDVMAITWKSWNNVYAPHKTYQWKRTGAADFDFSNWSGTGEPTADWLKLINIDMVDALGNPIQVTNR